MLALAGALLATLALAGDGAAWTGPRPAVTADELKPPIVHRFIPFPKKRRRQMAAYSERHYGDHTAVLSEHLVIVHHFTTSHDWRDAWWYFANNTPARGERPGVCSHFLIDTDGRIIQVMPLTVRCRHATGLNDVAIGIEDVGVSDGEILRNPRMMEAKIRLTIWLMARYGIPVRDVIGHAEILASPYHHDLVPRFRCMRHEDWKRIHMRRVRSMLRQRAAEVGLEVGPPPAWVKSGC